MPNDKDKENRNVRSVVDSTKKQRKAKERESLLDPIKEEEIPDYQGYLQEMVTVAQQDSATTGLGAKQIALAFVVTDPRVFPRTVTRFCILAGCDRSFYYLCRQNPKWVAFKNHLAKQLTAGGYDDAMVTLNQLVKNGDVKAIRLFFELRGDLVQRSESTVVNETAEERMKRIRAQEALKAGKKVEEGSPAPLPGDNQDDVPF